jgi:hypothetical protein
MMRSNIVLMLLVALFVMALMKGSNARRIQVNDDDENGFEMSNAKARSFLDMADEYSKRATGTCVTCSILTQSQCCVPDICIKKLLHNECWKVKPGK